MTGIDREECLNKLRESIPKDYTQAFRRANAQLPALRSRIAAWFEPWFRELEQTQGRPFYWMNDSVGPQKE